MISGGASACLELPASGLELQDLADVQRALLASGLPIGALNAVRKHLSALKGGGALRSTKGRVLALLLSDVPGDDPATIASGLFAADPSTYAGALASSGGRLYLTGVRPEVRAQIDRTRRLDLSGPVTIFEATPLLGESTRRAVAESEAWLVGAHHG